MGVRFNPHGFVIRKPDGVVIQDSRISAVTGKPIRQARILKAVPNTDGLYLSLHRADELKGTLAKTVYQRAREWFAEQQVAAAQGDPDPDGEQPPDPDGEDE